MKTEDLIRIGLLAANELGVPSDAKIVHVARGLAVRHTYKVKDVSETEELRQVERIELQPFPDPQPGFWLGYSEGANTLFLRLSVQEKQWAEGKRWVTRP